MEGAGTESRDSTLASVWRELDRATEWITLMGAGTVIVSYTVLFGIFGDRDQLLTILAAIPPAASAGFGLRRHSSDAEPALLTSAFAAMLYGGIAAPTARGGVWAVIVTIGMIGAFVLHDRKQRRFISAIVAILLGQLTWPVFGLATFVDAIGNLVISAVCAGAAIGFARIAKAALKRSEETRIEIFRSVPVGLFRARPDGQLIDANPALADMLMCDNDGRMIGYNVGGLYEDPEDWNALTERLEAQDVPQRFAHRMVRFDGEVIWVRGHAQVIRDQTGAVAYYEGAIEDVTQRRQTEEASRRHAERFRNVFERAPIAIWEEDFSAVGSRLDELRERGVTDLRQHLDEHPDELSFLVSLIRFVDVNQAGVALIGASSKAEALKAVIPEDAPAAVVEGFIEEFIAIWEDRDHLMLEIRGATATGGTTDLALSWAVGRTPAGELDLSRAVVAIQDIAIVKAAERELAALVESKDDLIAAVSHELRTPMTTILGMSSEMRDRAEEFSRTELVDFVALIADQSRELANIVEDLLVAARAEAGTLAVRPEPIDVATEIGRVTAIKPGISNPPSRDPIVAWADPLRLRQIVRNLLSNAERYGGDDVSIEVEHLDQVALVRVRDNGSGIPEGSRESVFEPYVRAEGDEGMPGSLGLGLPVSRRLARLMGGDLVYRWDGTSVFELRLPTTPEAMAA